METYKIENLTFAYPNRGTLALDSINLSLEQGAFAVICGPSGCGKTSLLRQLKPSTLPHGMKSGAVYFEGTPLDELSKRDAAAKIGFVLQSPENQIVTDKVWHELAFGLESLGAKTPEIRLRVAEMASFFGIQTWFHKSVTELSGGQKQLLALASIMTMQPAVLILDEPTSQLDPIAAGEFLNTIGKINRELGVTIILTEHRLEEVFPLSSIAVVMDKGRIIAKGPPGKVGLTLAGQNSGMFLAMPAPMRIWAAKREGECPITVREGAAWLQNQEIMHPLIVNDSRVQSGEPAIILNDIWFKYEKELPDVIKGLSFKSYFGEISAILGGNGTGKTTALSLMAGLYTPYRGKIHTKAAVYALPQNPQSLFTAKTVREDLLEILESTSEHRLLEIANLCRLEGLLDSHPYDLSGGEQQRAALAKVLLLEPKILLLDEPTKGLDAEYKEIFASILRKLAESGTSIIIVSHDAAFCAEHADRCSLFFDGGIVTENTPREFFSGNSFYTTSANRMARKVLPKAVTAGDVIKSLGGQLPPANEGNEENEGSDNPAVSEAIDMPTVSGCSRACLMSADKASKSKLAKRTILAAAIILFTIPLTIYLGLNFFNDRQFYFTSMLIILQTMIPFFMVFEGRKPQARELVIIAVLCAIAVAGRAAFFMLPQFKPVVAIVIIAGVAFGGEAGFLVGAITGFVSNMFFGQGPWTPWQMFAFGIIGFLAGILFRKGLLSRKPLPLSIFGGFAAFIIYGGIMNPAHIIMFQPSPTLEMFVLSYLHGIPFDLIHAAATVIFLTVISKSMLEKLDRIKIKYGLAEN